MLTIHETAQHAWLPFGRAEKVSLEDAVARLRALLDGRGWRTARDLAAAMQTDDRTIRALANASQGQIIGGQRGYCLVSQASVQDVEHVERFLLSQARAMIERARQIRIARNR